MKRFFLCSFFLLLATATTAMAQSGAAGKTYGGDRPAVEGSSDNQPPGKLTGVVDKIDKYRNGLRLTIKVGDKKVYQYSVYYPGQGPQTSLSVDKKCTANLKTIDDIQVADVVIVKLDAGNIKSLLLKERPADKGNESSSAKAPDKPND